MQKETKTEKKMYIEKVERQADEQTDRLSKFLAASMNNSDKLNKIP